MIQNWLNIVSISFNAQKSMMDYNPNIFWDALKNIVYVHLMIAISGYHSYKCYIFPVVGWFPRWRSGHFQRGGGLGMLGSHIGSPWGLELEADRSSFPTMVQGIYKYLGLYPLVNIQKAMENHLF